MTRFIKSRYLYIAFNCIIPSILSIPKSQSMRRELAKQEGQRKKFRATFIRIGKKTNYQGYPEETLLLNRIVDVETGKVVTDHLWFTFTKGFQDARIKEGDTIEFEARVKEYNKGYVNRTYGINNRKQDYKLSHPTRIAVVHTPPDNPISPK